MSNSKLQKYIDIPIQFNGRLNSKPILISDSKGNYLRPHSDIITNFGYNIDFVCKGGARFQDYFYWLQSNLHKKVQQYGKIKLYIWLGTCDLTIKKGKFTELRHTSDSAAFSYLKYQIDRYISFVSNFPSVTLVFLEIPPYSIKDWNNSKGHSNPQSFHSQDLALLERVFLVNEYIRSVNERDEKFPVTSPRFKLDLLRFRKSKGNKSHRVSYNFSVYKDGIHPGYLLARCWMKRLVSQILTDCCR